MFKFKWYVIEYCPSPREDNVPEFDDIMSMHGFHLIECVEVKDLEWACTYIKNKHGIVGVFICEDEETAIYTNYPEIINILQRYKYVIKPKRGRPSRELTILKHLVSLFLNISYPDE